MDFDEALARLGFAPSSDRAPRGVRAFVARPNPFLTYTVQAFEPDKVPLEFSGPWNEPTQQRESGKQVQSHDETH